MSHLPVKQDFLNEQFCHFYIPVFKKKKILANREIFCKLQLEIYI